MSLRKLSNETMMTVPISDAEKSIAIKVKDSFGVALNDLLTAVDIVTDLRDAVVSEQPTPDDINKKYKLLFKKYKHDIIEGFNSALIKVKSALELLSEIIDPDMMRLREIIITEVGELSDGAEKIMDTLDESEKDDFIKKIEYIATQMEKRERSVIEVIETQLFGHIDHDILGRMKISDIRIRIMKRASAIRSLSQGAL